MLNKIVVTSDGSERAGRAVEFAGSMAEKFAAKLTVLHVRVGEGQVPRAELDAQAASAHGVVEVVTDERPADAICRFADEWDADAIVLGNYGMSDRKQFLLGNVPNRVSHQAQCTVIIVDTRDAKERKRHRGRYVDGRFRQSSKRIADAACGSHRAHDVQARRAGSFYRRTCERVR